MSKKPNKKSQSQPLTGDETDELIGPASSSSAREDVRPDPPHQIEALTRYFGIDQSIHTLTLIHLTFHSLTVVALAELAASATALPARALCSVLGLVGLVATEFSRVREARNQRLREYWEGPERETHYEGEEGMRGWIRPKTRLAPMHFRHSRRALFYFLMALYVGVGSFPWLNAF